MPLEKLVSSLKDENIEESELANLINGFDHFEIARRLNELITEDKVRVFHLLDVKYYDLKA